MIAENHPTDDAETQARLLLVKLPPIINTFLDDFSQSKSRLEQMDYDANQLHDWHHYYTLTFPNLMVKAATVTGDMDKLISINNSMNTVEAHLSLFDFVGPEKLPEQFNLNKDFGVIYALQKSYESIFYHQRTMNNLLTKIEGGFDTNDNLIQKVLQIDKTAINLPCIQNRIKEAQIKNDQKFFNKIGNVMLNRSPLEIHEDAHLTFAIFWLIELNLFNFFTDYGKYELLKSFNKTHISRGSFLKKIRKISKLH